MLSLMVVLMNLITFNEFKVCCSLEFEFPLEETGGWNRVFIDTTNMHSLEKADPHNDDWESK